MKTIANIITTVGILTILCLLFFRATEDTLSKKVEEAEEVAKTFPSAKFLGQVKPEVVHIPSLCNVYTICIEGTSYIVFRKGIANRYIDNELVKCTEE